MKLEQSFEVAAPIEQVWEALIDVERVAPCLPGASVSSRNEDGSYDGTFTIKIGPTTASYTGRLEMESVDEAERTATMRAQGSDKRGQGGAKAMIVSRLVSSGEAATRVEVNTEYSITGRLARFGRGGMIEDISERLLREFATRLQASLAGEPAGEPAQPPAGEAAEPDTPSAEDEPAPVAPDGQPSAPNPQPPDEKAPEAPPPPSDAPEPPPPPSDAPEPAPPPPPPTPPPAEPVQGVSLVGGVLLERIRRNPAPLAAGLGVLLLLRRLLRRH